MQWKQNHRRCCGVRKKPRRFDRGSVPCRSEFSELSLHWASFQCLRQLVFDKWVVLEAVGLSCS
jgi:hypothetical protein